jgi:hypothetical protein
VAERGEASAIAVMATRPCKVRERCSGVQLRAIARQRAWEQRRARVRNPWGQQRAPEFLWATVGTGVLRAKAGARAKSGERERRCELRKRGVRWLGKWW